MIWLSLKQMSTAGSTILIGLLAGIMLGTGLAMYTARALPEKCWTTRFQLEDALFAKTMPPLFFITVVALVIAAAVEQRTVRWFFAVAALLALGSLVLTVGLEVPINHQIQTWVPGSAPADWQTLRDRWLMNHLYRTIIGILALICSVAGLAWR